ncbi:aBC-type maltose/maltodextrin transport system ATP-binding protein MalK [Firmicutes bacterium CAG:449]|nr:aBC-type maltose/maltodextrin transport system ATP-binding protein MalK [Firmicutes bacterium CAG:449]
MEVKLVNLTKVFSKKEGNVVAVDHINITIPTGKLVGLLGPSGCGKSTTLYMIAGLHRPTEGEIYFGENEVSKYPPEKRGIGLVFQNYALYPHLSVKQNIMFPLENKKMPKEEAEKKALEYAKIVGIEGLMDRKPGQLSGGQQQRVAIARALVKEPDVLLLDEPLSNLDARLRLQTREEIKRIQRETGVTAIFVTHDQEEAMSISDEIVVMNFGVVHQIGKPQEVYNEPVDMFVAKFLGTPPINIIPAKYNAEKKKVTFYNDFVRDTAIKNINFDELLANKVSSEENNLETENNDLDLFIGVRPEFIKIDEKGKYKVTVDMVEYIGRDKSMIFKFKGQENTCKAIIPSDVEIEPGQEVKVNFKRFFVFDKEGKRLL